MFTDFDFCVLKTFFPSNVFVFVLFLFKILVKVLGNTRQELFKLLGTLKKPINQVSK